MLVVVATVREGWHHFKKWEGLQDSDITHLDYLDMNYLANVGWLILDSGTYAGKSFLFVKSVLETNKVDISIWSGRVVEVPKKDVGLKGGSRSTPLHLTQTRMCGQIQQEPSEEHTPSNALALTTPLLLQK